MKFERLTTEQQVLGLLEWHNAHSDFVVLDCETTGLDPFRDSVLAFVLSGREASSAYFCTRETIHALKALRKPVVAHNFKFDFHMLLRAGVDLRGCGLHGDTMLLHHLIDENKPHDLDSLVREEFGDAYKEEFWAKYKTFEEASEADQLDYACKDVVYTRLLYEVLMGRLRDDDIPSGLVTHVHRLALALYDTEVTGIRVDLDYLMQMGTKLKAQIDEIVPKMKSLVPAQIDAIEHELWAKEIDKLWSPRGKKWQTLPKPEFTFDSNPQLCDLLYQKLKLPPQRNKKQNYTADDEALERNKDQHALVPLIQEYRGLHKVYGSYIEGTLERMHQGRIHPSFNVNGTVTGRISSSNPNMQQLPRNGGVRGIYVPDPGMVYISCDYSQLEVVIAAHFSQDRNLLRIIRDGASQHDITADALGIPRHIAKTLNFAMQYQCSHYKVAKIVGCSEREAERLWNKYWDTYSGVKRIIDECKRKVDRGEAIVNPFGRKRRFPVRFEQKWQREAAYRQAFSSLIQGTGADITHWAFYSISEVLKEQGLGRAMFEVHDEIVIEVPREHAEEASEYLTGWMLQAGVEANLSVPLKVDCSDPLERWSK